MRLSAGEFPMSLKLLEEREAIQTANQRIDGREGLELLVLAANFGTRFIDTL